MQGEDVRFRHVIDMASLRKLSSNSDTEFESLDPPTRGEVVG
jgi:hypothetical protein